MEMIVVQSLLHLCAEEPLAHTHPVEVRGLIYMMTTMIVCQMLVMRVRPATPDRGSGRITSRVALAPRVEPAPGRKPAVDGTVRTIATNGGRRQEPVRILVQGGLEVGRLQVDPGAGIPRRIQLPIA